MIPDQLFEAWVLKMMKVDPMMLMQMQQQGQQQPPAPQGMPQGMQRTPMQQQPQSPQGMLTRQSFSTNNPWSM